MLFYIRYLNYLKSKKILLILLLLSLSSFAQIKLPILKARVTDNAHVFNDSEKESLEIKLTNLEEQTSHQIVVVTIVSLHGETINGYALELFEKNNLGQKNLNNGLLILFSDQDRKVRIEVGYGLESIITDALASRIIREIMIPNFKEGEKFKGINEATTKIIEFLKDPALAEEFIKTTEAEVETDATFMGALFGTLFLGPTLFLLGIFGYNKTIAKNKIAKKINMMDLYKKNPTNFFGILILGMLVIGYFIKFFASLFFVLFIIGFLSVFVLIGIKVILKEAYSKLKKLLKGVFTGELGIIIFPFYLPSTILLSFGGLLFTCVPIIMGIFPFVEIVLNKNINDFLSPFEIIYLIYFLAGVFILFLIIVAIKAIQEIREKRKPFGISLFKNNISISSSFSRGSGSRSSSYSSSGSSYSSSSSSSFSGGGGSSGGGGASGSW